MMTQTTNQNQTRQNQTPRNATAQPTQPAVISFNEWLTTERGRGISFEKNERAKLQETFTAGFNAAATNAPEAKPAPVIEMTEAPYSWNVSAQDANGFIEMFTVRAVSFEGFTSRVEMMKARLVERGYKPAPTRGAAASAAQTHGAETQPDAAPVCAIHKTPMQERTGRNGQKFWSCPQRLDTGEFCPYRPPKQ